MAVVSLAFEDNGRLHNDLVLRLNSIDRRCDSYYLAEDPELLPGRRDAHKVRSVLVRLLEQWREAVTHLGHDGVTYLPYEFDDEATGWLQVAAVEQNEVEVLPVWSDLEGWAINPSCYSEGLERIGRTSPVWKELLPQRMSRRELLDQIEGSLAAR